jgi:hypothetical protein
MRDGSVHYYITNISWKFHQLADGQLLSVQPIRYGNARRHGPSITHKIPSSGLLSSSQPGGTPCWTRPLQPSVSLVSAPILHRFLSDEPGLSSLFRGKSYFMNNNIVNKRRITAYSDVLQNMVKSGAGEQKKTRGN